MNDQTANHGNDQMANYGSRMNRSDADENGWTNEGNDADQSADDTDNNRGNGNWNWHHRYRWSNNMPMHQRMGAMWRRRMMMQAMGGARFHFTRGNARIDVRCSAQEDMQACVRAAGELLDKVAELHGARGANTTGSAAGENSGATNDTTNGSANGATPSTPDHQPSTSPGERM
jgi:hypothetical protein